MNIKNLLYTILEKIVWLLKMYLGLYPYFIQEFGLVKGMLVDLLIFIVTAKVLWALYEFRVNKKLKKRGNKSEKDCANMIRKCFGVEPIQNVLIPIEDIGNEDLNPTTEIDLIAVTTKGIFCFEVKGRINKITGELYENYWTVGGTQLMNNPIYQNNGHVKALRSFLTAAVRRNIYNTVYIDASCELYENNHELLWQERVIDRMESDELFVIPRKALREDITKCIDRLPDFYTEQEVEKITELLRVYVGDKKQLKKHVKYLKYSQARAQRQEEDRERAAQRMLK